MSQSAINKDELVRLVSDYRTLFWYTSDKDLKNIRPNQVVETILNYGDEIAVKRLFEIMGIDEVAKIFDEQMSNSERTKNNYHELVANFFRLYFSRHAKRYSVK